MRASQSCFAHRFHGRSWSLQFVFIPPSSGLFCNLQSCCANARHLACAADDTQHLRRLGWWHSRGCCLSAVVWSGQPNCGTRKPPLALPPASMEGTRRDVEVDQRALVKKILARYPTPFPPIRELVQNADDAGATEVRLSLEHAAPGEMPIDADDAGGSSAYPALRRVCVWNNGRAFTEADWQR
eukprot:6836472-Prymnesium_polylepis.1